MTITYTSLLGLTKPDTGTQSGTWGSDLNTGLTDYLDAAVAGAQVISGSQTAVTLSVTTGNSGAPSALSQAGSGATGSSQYQIIRCTGNPASTLVIDVPKQDKTYIVINATSTSQTVTLRGGPSTPTTGVNIVAGEKAVCAWNGSDFVKVGGAAGGTNTQVQYNNNGVFGGSADLTWDGSTLATTGLTASGAVTLSATSQNIALGTSQVGGTWTAGGASQTGAITLDQSTKTHTLNIGTGATENALTKTINLGTAGVSGSTTAINIGSAVSGATTNVTLNGTVQPGVVISGSSSGDALRITQTGAGNALLVEDSTNPDSSPFVVNASGNVGIGTSSPAQKLDVRGGSIVVDTASAGLNPTVFFDHDNFASGTRNFIQMNRSTEAMLFSVANADRMTLDSSGNLGLGVTPSAWGSGRKAIQIGGVANNYFIGSQNTVLGNNAYNDGTNWIYLTSFNASLYTQSEGGQHQWFNAPSGTAGNAITFTQAMTLDASGNLSVGTTTTPTQITFAGSSGITYQRSTDNTFSGVLDYLKSRGSAASPTAVQNGDDLFTLRVVPYHGSAYTYLTNTVVQVDGTFTSGQNPPTRIAWYTNAANGGSTERARITSGGYFKASDTGTYASSTGTYHELRSSTSNARTVIVTNTASSLPFGILVDYTGAAPNGTGNAFLECQDTGGARFVARSNGGLANYQSNNVDLSDARTKKDITPAPSYWNKIAALEIVTYKYNDQTHDDINVGVIAQQVESVEPVWVDADGFGKTPEDGVPLKTVYTKDITFAAIKALQEAMARIEKLEAEVAALKGTQP